MPGALLPERTPLPGPRRVPPVSGKLVLLAVLAVGVTLVGGVGTFAALTRPPRHSTPPALTASAAPAPPGMGL